MILYIYKLQCNKYYLGLSKDFISIFFKHFNDIQNDWINIYKPIQILDIFQFKTLNDLDYYVLYYMYKYGIDNVRGGSFNKIVFDSISYNNILSLILLYYN
jgi:hypothetical protein|tara:strand:- start:1763 stop:2065 length:303 start_codon:yes stop_codon:yes gene_type:complete